MPKKDIYHEQVRKSLEKDGWVITHDPMRFRWKGRTIWPDLGVERVIAAERGVEKIAVEIKSFIEPVPLHEFYEAIGQYDTYKAALAELDKDRIVVLAVSKSIYEHFISQEFASAILGIKEIPFFVYDIDQEIIIKWIK
ncbi:MAG: element excision factor XisH family protein [Saprospiraceae bacterium]